MIACVVFSLAQGFINYGNMWGSIKVIGFKTLFNVYPFMIS